jgi:hypothetical protein
LAHGDIAAAEGIAIVPPTALVADGYDEINRTLDTIVIQDNRIRNDVGPTVADVNAASPTAGAMLLVRWNAEGRIQAVDPAAPADVASKHYVDVTTAKALALINALVQRVVALEARFPEDDG